MFTTAAGVAMGVLFAWAVITHADAIKGFFVRFVMAIRRILLVVAIVGLAIVQIAIFTIVVAGVFCAWLFGLAWLDPIIGDVATAFLAIPSAVAIAYGFCKFLGTKPQSRLRFL